MKKLTCALLSALLVLLSYCASAQTRTDSTIIIKGRVTDAETRKPLAGTSVYLNGTYLGTSTDTAGNFSLTAIKTNTPLMVSYVGYESQTIKNYSDNGLDISLKPKVNRLKEVTITVDEMSREKKMKLFLRQFIGEDYKDCAIGNPDDIWLHYNKNKFELTAGADKPLLITNKKLGYKVTYFLDTFRYTESISRGNETNYRGNYFFAEDTTGLKPAEIKKILTARDDAFFGSRMHFIRTLWADKLTQNNFKILTITSSSLRLNVYDEKKSKRLYNKDIVGIKNDHIFHDQKYMALPSEVSVLYQPRKHKEGTSYLKQEKGYDGVLIDSNGYYGEGIDWNGDMGTDRVSKLLPFEFEPVGK